MTSPDFISSLSADALRRVWIGGVPKSELWSKLQTAGVRFNHDAENLFRDKRFETFLYPKLLKTVEISVGQLGMTDGATFPAIVENARNQELRLCPLELGPHLRLQFTDQAEVFVGLPKSSHRAPPGSITVASAPLADDVETPKGFYLRRIEGVLWLRGYRASLDHIYQADDVFVFVFEAMFNQLLFGTLKPTIYTGSSHIASTGTK